MKLSVWAKQSGVHYATAWKWFKEGKLPVKAYQTPTGTILIDVSSIPTKESRKVAVYARVSSSDQKADLDRQVSRIVSILSKKEVYPELIIKEVGSGMNGRRKQFLTLLRNPEITHIVVEHRDRLTRFGFEYIEAALIASNRRVIVLDKEELKEDMVRDITEFMTSVCARLYGRRSAANKTKRLKGVFENEK